MNQNESKYKNAYKNRFGVLGMSISETMIFEDLTRYTEIFDSLLKFTKPDSVAGLVKDQKLTGLQYVLAKQEELRKSEAGSTAGADNTHAGGQPIIESGNLDDWENGDGDAGGSGARHVTPFERMQHCRDALEYLDSCGWNRSYHQRLFHEDFLVSSACKI